MTNTDLHPNSPDLIPMHLPGTPSEEAFPDSGEASIHSLMLPKVPRRTYSSNYLEVASLVVPAHAPII